MRGGAEHEGGVRRRWGRGQGKGAPETGEVHGLPFSTCTARILACLNEKEVDYELIPVDLVAGAHQRPPFLALNPFGQIPAIQDGDLTLFESRAIIKYLARKYEGRGTNLLGNTLVEQAVVDQWCEVESQQFNPLNYAVVFQTVIQPKMGGTTDHKVVEASLEKLNKVLDIYEKSLSKNKYLAGDFFSLADLQHLSAHYLVKACGKGDVITSRKYVNAWWEDISSRPAWKRLSDHMNLM
eukprot:Gb_31239 [translate_table: standard]